jgi:transcriptional regulator with XRE-family HTH domain
MNSYKANIKIGKIIRASRKAEAISQLTLANKLGYTSAQFVSQFERGIAGVPVEKLGIISKILKIPLRYFVQIHADNFKRNLSKKIKLGKTRKILNE